MWRYTMSSKLTTPFLPNVSDPALIYVIFSNHFFLIFSHLVIDSILGAEMYLPYRLQLQMIMQSLQTYIMPLYTYWFFQFLSPR